MAPRSNARLPRIPEMTIRRLSVYTRCLLQLEEDGVKTVSSQELAERFNLNSAQVARTWRTSASSASAGSATTSPGSRPSSSAFSASIASGRWRLVGFGNLGSALFHYKGFARQGFRIAAIFDEDPRKVAREIDSTPIFPSRDLGREVKARGIQVAIVAVPAESAQAVADQLVAAGIKAILNFAPARIKVPKDVRFKNVDLSIELETLSFYLAKSPR
jgi:redox-sensing transcriptional repressor